jgi:hypothetical protein
MINFFESCFSNLAHRYHRAKTENNIFTTRYESNNIIEKAGDFFLAPAHFLMSGRTIVPLTAHKFSEEQTYDYRGNCCWFVMKVVLAILSLPIALMIGSSLKGLSLLSSSIRERNSAFAEFTVQIISNQTTYQRIGLELSEDFIPCEEVPKPDETEMDPQKVAQQKIQKKVLYDVTQALGNLPYWMACGTLLGAHRHGDMIPWDYDVDLSILRIDHKNAMNLLKQGLDSEKYEVLNWSSLDSPGSYIRVYVKELAGMPSGAYVDLYEYEINEADNTVQYLYGFQDSPFVPQLYKNRELLHTKPLNFNVVFPLKQARLGELTLRAPNNTKALLESGYGDIRPAKIWNPETKQFEKVADHPYWAPGAGGATDA